MPGLTKHTVEITRAEHAAVITLAWETGQRYRIGHIAFKGSQFRDGFLDRYLPFHEGDYFSQDQLLQLQQALNGADYFSVVNVMPDIDNAKNGVVNVNVDLAPAPRTIYTGGPFIGTDTGVGLRGGIEKRWVNDRGHKWKNEIVAAQRLKTLTSLYTIPMPGPDQRSFNFGATFRDADTTTSTAHTLELVANETKLWHGWTRVIGLHALTGTFTVGKKGGETDNTIGIEHGRSTLLYPEISLSRKSGDNPTFVRRGWSVTLTARSTVGTLLSSTGFTQFLADGKWIRSFAGNNRWIVRGTAGYTTTKDFSDLPPQLRFFAGGDRSVRGYGFESLGPRNDFDRVIGGKNLLVASNEVEHYFTRNWGMAAFVDAGNAFSGTNISPASRRGPGRAMAFPGRHDPRGRGHAHPQRSRARHPAARGDRTRPMTDTAARTPLPRRRRWWRFALLTLGTLLVLLVAFAWWLLGTTSGLSFALARAQGFTAGALQVGQADGRLIGPLTLTNVRYDDGKGTRATVGSIEVDYALRALLGRTVHVRRLDVEDVSVSLPAPQPDTEAPAPFSLEPPVVMQLDQAHVGKVTIVQEGKPLFASNTLDLAASWTKKGIEVHQLTLRAPDGEANLTGTLAVGKGYRGDGQAQVSWKVGDTRYAGKVVAHSDGAKAKLSISVTEPTLAQVDMDLVQSGDYAWTAKIDAPRFDPKPLLGESSLTALGLHVQGSGDRYGANLTGDADVNEYHLRLTPLRAHFDKDYKTLTLEQLNLATDRFKGALQASGTVDLGASPVSANLTLAWTDLLLPADLVGQDLASQGKVTARGSADAFHVEGAVDVGPPGKLARLALNIDGTPQRIALNTLTVLQAKGKLDATGTLTLQPELAWKLEAKAEHFDPGQLAAGYDGSLDFDLGTEGVLAKAGPHGTLDLRKLIGTVRKREVGGSGELTLKPNRVVNGKLQLNSGNSTVGIDARGDAANDADVRLAIASLGDWVPDAGGKIDGRFNVKGLVAEA